MKLTNEDLRKIILEEVEEVLKEFHGAIDGEDEDEKKPVTTNDMSKKFYGLSKDLKTPEARADMKQGELTIANEIFDEIMRILRKERDNKTFMTKIKNSMDRLIKAEDK